MRTLLTGIAIAAVIWAMTACSHHTSDAHGPLTLGWVVDPSWSQVPVAEKAGYFKDAGVDVKIVPFPTGAAALEALNGGAIDVVNGGDVPTSAAVLKNPKVRIIADGARWTEGRFVARRSAGIGSISDLAGRKIAVPLGSSAHYFATRFLTEAHVDAQLVQTGPAEIVTAITNHDVDVVAVFQPPLAKVVAALGSDAIELQGKDKYNQHSLYLANADTVANRPADLAHFVAAIRRADAPLTNREPAALAAVAAATALDPALIAKVAGEFEFKTQLGPELAADLADRARWAQGIGRISQNAQIPDYSTSIVRSLLDGTAP